MPPKAKKPRPQPSPADSHLKETITRLPSGPTQPGKPLSNTPHVNGQQQPSKQEEDIRAGDTTESASERPDAPTVNRKKQKRRDKEAAKRAASQPLPNGHSPSLGRGPTKGYFTEDAEVTGPARGQSQEFDSNEDDFYSGDEEPEYGHHIATQTNSSWLNTSKRKKSKGKKGSATASNVISRTSTATSRPHVSTVSNAALRSAHRMSNDLWNPTTQTERDQIKEYWLQLGEDERRNLVRIEKEAVLRKMKEQQKHSCSCSVCGRKRTAIEEELEVLYDAYYEELEQFATPVAGAPLPAHNSAYRRPRHQIPGAFSSSGRVQELDDDDEEIDEEGDYDYSEEEDEELDYDLPPGPPDFFHFGNSLQVKDGILTVADDLLKNEGRNFIDMMEQLAERRMQREEEIHFPSSALTHQDVHQGHNHAPLDDEDDYDDEEDDDEYDSQEEDDYDPEDMEDSMTEEQRMEEGRRMFQIFAARMFEQRVLTAWKEKVSAERTQALINELDEDKHLEAQREAKKARDAAKKKEKKKAVKAAKDEEKARKDAEKAAQEAAVKEAEEKRLEEQRQRKDDQRKKRDAERKAAEDDRLKKEADKLRRQQETKDRQVEAERKAKEAKDRERAKKEEAKKREREEREAKEKEARERKVKETQERKAKEEQLRKEKETAAKEARERPVITATSARPQPVALPPGLTPPTRPGPVVQSPNVQAAVPAPPTKAPTPARVRQTSQPTSQAIPSHGSSPKSQQGSTEHSASPAGTLPQTPGQTQPIRNHGQPPPLHHPQPSAPRSPLNNPNRNHYSFNMNGLPGLGVSGPPTAPGMMPGMMGPMPMYGGPQGQPMAGHPRYGPNGVPFPQHFGGPRQFQPQQPMPYHTQAPIPANLTPQQPIATNSSHSRQASGSNLTETSSQPAPIGRPGPIARPSSTTPDKQPRKRSEDPDVENITTQLGSKALLDDSDEPIPPMHDNGHNIPTMAAPGTGRLPFSSTFGEPKPEAFNQSFRGFGASQGWGSIPQAPRPMGGWPQQPFGGPLMSRPKTMTRSHLPRPIAVRLMLVEACRQLSLSGETFHSVQHVLVQLQMLQAPGEPHISMEEMLGICDTEGNSQNGGGSFEIMMDKNRGQVIKYTEDNALPRGSVGDIGSPLPGHLNAATFPIGQHHQPSFGPPGRGF